MEIKLLTTHGDHEIIKTHQITNYTVLNLAVDFWWMKPTVGTDATQLDEKTQCLMAQYQDGDTQKKLVLILAAHNQNKGILNVQESLRVRPATTKEATLGCVIYDVPSFEAGLLEAAKQLTKHIPTFKLRTEKQVPDYYDHFGWCTWDVFYKKISEENIEASLQTFKARNISPYYMVLDDGWQDYTHMHLNSIFENSKFKSGLKTLIEKAKRDYNIQMFGIWHALQGYWGGISQEGPLAKSLTYVSNENIKSSPYTTYFTTEGHYIHEDEIQTFYEWQYEYLNQCGVDFVKVDSQGSLLHLTENADNSIEIMHRYQQALSTVGKRYFNQNVLYCMSHPLEVIFNTNDYSAWRNSDDFFPKLSLDVQLDHLYINAMNNLFSSTFAYPDWDMFQTNHPQALLHGLTRAISGGPVYVCDAPQDVNVEMLNKLIVDVNQVLRFKQPALPFETDILIDPKAQPKLFKVKNQSSYGETVMAVNMHENKMSITEQVKTWYDDVILVWPVTNEVKRAKAHESLEMTLGYGEVEYVNVMPYREITPLGLLDKYNGYLSIQAVVEDEQQMRIQSIGEGVFSLYVEDINQVESVSVNGLDVDVIVDDLKCLKVPTLAGQNEIVINKKRSTI